MRKPLTDRQQSFLDWIANFIQQFGKSPTMQELGDYFHVKPPSAFDVVNALVKKGFLQKKGRAPFRTLELIDELGRLVTPGQLPLVGEVAAGVPVLAMENRIGAMTVDDRMLKRGASFALKIRGESMIEAGILNGDFVIIRSQSTAIHGDIVLALIGEEATVKRYYECEGGMIRLRPANSEMSDIIVPAESCLIQGIVIGVIREM